MNEPIKMWLSAEQAAEYLQVDRRTILSWVRDGKLKGRALSGTQRKVWRFTYDDLNELLEG